MPQGFHCCRDQFTQRWGMWPQGLEAHASSHGNSCRNSSSLLLEATFCNVGKPTALAELLAVVPGDTMRTRQETHSQIK